MGAGILEKKAKFGVAQLVNMQPNIAAVNKLTCS